MKKQKQQKKRSNPLKHKIENEPDFVKDSETSAILFDNDQKYNEFFLKAKEKQKLEMRLNKIELSLGKIESFLKEILDKKI